MQRLALALVFLAASASAQFSAQTSVDLPASYQPADTQALLRSIDYPRLAKEADAAVPGAIAAKVKFFYQPIVFHSALGRPDRMGIVVLVEAQPGWGRESELKSFLAHYLERRIAERSSTPSSASGPS